jgi:16S rRNA (guanine527-N7)-methyltransferase
MTVGAATSLESSVAAIAEGARALALVLPTGAERRLADFLALLGKWNRVYNLTAIREPERMVTHHVLDSLAIVPALEALGVGQAGVRVLDVGSGGGLPGLPLAIARPQWQVTLCEPSHKKATFLAQAVAELALSNVEVAALRVEDCRPAHPFGVVVSRAFSDLATFVAAARPHLAPGGVIVAMKGVVPEEEIADLPSDVEIVAMPVLAVPGLDAARHLIVMKRKEPE